MPLKTQDVHVVCPAAILQVTDLAVTFLSGGCEIDLGVYYWLIEL